MASDEQPADRDLIARALAGDQRAFALLVRRYGRPVYTRISRTIRYPEDAEDLLQEVFVRAYTQLERLRDPGRATVAMEGLLKAVDLIADHLAPRHPTDPEGTYQYVPTVEIRLTGSEQGLSLATTREMGYSRPPDTEGKRQDCSMEEVLCLTGNTPVWTFSTSIPAQIETDGPEEVFRIGVNHTYLRDMVRALGLDPDEALEIRFVDPFKAILFLPVRHTDRKGLLMPLRMRRSAKCE